MSVASEVVAGVDLGGTATRFAIVNCETNALIASKTVTTESLVRNSFEESTAEIASLIRSVAGPLTDFKGVGVGASGPVDTKTGVISNPDTLPGFSGLSVTQALSRHMSLPVGIENDSVCAAMGEYLFGHASGSKRLLMVTLGTGIGVACIDHGRPFRGADGSHPEAGHIGVGSSTEHCYCGVTGCWEQMASRTTLESLAASILPNGLKPMNRLPWIKEHAADADVEAILNDYGVAVARGLLVLLDVYRPDLVVLGGSVAGLLPRFHSAIISHMKVSDQYRIDVPIVEGSLGSLAGALGAAFIGQETYWPK